jgi:alpha-glutamyl/putrescinyl thymine pyrophosphorylase clade 1
VSMVESQKAVTDFAVERENIRRKHDAGLSFPWTNDSILRDYRFCNVERERDTVTKDVTALYREPHKDDPDLWFALLAVTTHGKENEWNLT